MTYKEYKQCALEGNPELSREYGALAPQYAVINAVIAARIEKKMTQAELATLHFYAIVSTQYPVCPHFSHVSFRAFGVCAEKMKRESLGLNAAPHSAQMYAVFL